MPELSQAERMKLVAEHDRKQREEIKDFNCTGCCGNPLVSCTVDNVPEEMGWFKCERCGKHNCNYWTHAWNPEDPSRPRKGGDPHEFGKGQICQTCAKEIYAIIENDEEILKKLGLKK